MKKTILIFALFASSAFAGQFRLTMENDCPFKDDSDYSHGTRVEYIDKYGLRFGLQQQMYTPYDISTEEQIGGRHPYAGYLVGFVGIRSVELHAKPHLSAYQDAELQLGVLGPSSGAEETQRIIHKMIGSKDPKGWDHQLKDEFVAQSVYWLGADWLVLGREQGWSLHLSSEIGGLLGTLQVAPGANTTLKMGYGFSSGAEDREIQVRSLAKPKKSVYILLGAEGKWWLRNELLEGNASYVHNHDTLTVEKEDLTGGIRAGAGFQAGNFDFRLNILFLSREYKTQKATPNYASISLGWAF